MKRANKVVLAQPAAAAPPLLPRAPGPGPARGGAGGVGEASRARLRHRSLLQDYKELLKVGWGSRRSGLLCSVIVLSDLISDSFLCLISSVRIFLCLGLI